MTQYLFLFIVKGLLTATLFLNLRATACLLDTQLVKPQSNVTLLIVLKFGPTLGVLHIY